MGVIANGTTYSASGVVIAAGAWSGHFSEQLNVRIPVEPQRGQIVHARLSTAQTSNWTIVLEFFRRNYLVPWREGRLAMGATRESGTGYDPRVTVAGIHDILSETLRLAPGLGNAEVEEIRVGLRPLSPDGLPILGPVDGMNNVYLATGHGASGLQLGPYSGKVTADLALGRDPGVDVAPFLVTRFAKA